MCLLIPAYSLHLLLEIVESETFDLAGNSPSTITTTIQSAFSTPLPLSSMIRITFVTGAGKLARQKYDENAAKTVSSTLRDLGYVEDRGASCVNECAGMFKSQHDTGKNLKTIVVFPLITESNAVGDGIGSMSLNESSVPSLLEEGSPKEMIAMTSNMNNFERMISTKCPSWSQKKSCGAVITELKSMLETLDSKLLRGTPLDDAEQQFYDSISMDSLEQKANFVRDGMKKHVDDGNVTKSEKEKLLSQVTEKLDGVKKDIDVATKEKKPKKVDKLTLQKEKLTERLNSIDDITPKLPSPLKFQADISKLRKELQPLIKLEKETKGRLLSIKETAMMTRKEEIEEEILILEERSRGWFEEDEEFQIRVNASRAKVVTTVKKVVKKSSGNGMTGGMKKPITNWVVPGAGKKKVTKKATAKKSSATNAFAAMMMDSDSDSD